MEWLKKMSLRKSLFLVIIVTFAVGNMLNQLVLHILRNLTGACMCAGSLTAILMSIMLSFIVPFIIATIFYNIKLKTPLSQLSMGAKKIKENNLDFSIMFRSKDELGQLCASFESMRIELLKSNRELWQQMEERKRLNAAFAHDLRTPVTVLKGSALILEKGLAQGNLAEAHISENISLITQYSDRIESYIQAITSVQKLEELAFAPKMSEWISFAKEMEGSLNILGDHAGKKVEFVTHGKSSEIAIDKHMIHNVVENLVVNALRYARVVVKADMSLDDKKITITVLDDGEGFPTEILEKGAAPFLYDGSHSEHFGMGLYICHLLCEKHGGSLTLENHSSGAKVIAVFHI